MAKIVVFDSGLGSLSIIKPIQKKFKSEIIYFADQKNFPYGTKSISELKKIITSTISMVQQKFEPDVIIIGSNTPSILLKNILKPNIIGVFPPLKEAAKKTKRNTIAILATKSVVESIYLNDYIRKNLPKKIKILKINASPLVELVEYGKFIYDKNLYKSKIKFVLSPLNNADVATLSSTHLPFLLPLLKEIFPNIVFLDPANDVVNQVINLNLKKSKTNILKIFTSGNVKKFQRHLQEIGIKNKVHRL